MSDLQLNAAETVLVVIDLQQGIVSRTLAPHTAQDVIARSVKLADRFRELKAPVVLVRVSFSPGGPDAPPSLVDEPTPGARPEGWDVLIPELGDHASDIRITKKQWGAFYGTELDLQLRRRGVKNIVICGVATNMGVESTARSGWEHGYAMVFAEDAISTMSAEWHQFAVKSIFPRIGRVRSTQQVLDSLR